MRRAEVVRVGWGALLVLAPGVVLRGAQAPQASKRAMRIARLLGSRQLVQGTVTLLGGGAHGVTRGVGAVVDGLHAGSALALAALSPRWRLTAGADAVVAAAFAATAFVATDRDTRMDRTQAGRQKPATTTPGGSS